MENELDPHSPDFEETRWIVSEDVNVEHLLKIFTTIDADSEILWLACINFIRNFVWHKNRPINLRPKVEGLPDNHS